MQNKIHTKEVKEHLGQTISVAGFAQSIRDQGNIKFLILRDVTGIIQCVILKNCADFDKFKEITLESVLLITGLAKEEKQAPNGYEIQVEKIEILSKSDPELPIPVVIEKGGEEPDQPKRLDWRWIDLRRPEKGEIFKVATYLENGIRKYFAEKDFIQLYTPTFMGAPSESGAEVFEVPYFETKAYLAQSPQFHKQMAMAAGFEKVFIFGTVYRAEPSFTTRHVTEVVMWDLEISYIESHHDVMDVEEELLRYGFKEISDKLGTKLEIPQEHFPRITMKEAKEKLKAKNVPGPKEHDLTPEEEKEICDIIKEETGSDFVFITDWHISARPFYHMRYQENPEITKSFDLLYKGIEITTGAQREHRPDILVKQAEEKGLDPKNLTDYLNYFKYGCPPHGGLAIGPGRVVMKIMDLPNIREAVFLPRDVKRLTP